MVDLFTLGEAAAHVAGQASLIVSYIANVRNAPTRLQQLQRQLQLVIYLAQCIEEIPKHRNPLPAASFDDFRAILDDLATRIEKQGSFDRLLWPLNEKDTDKYFRDVESYKSTFTSLFSVRNA
jgi:hypothetical protein